MRARALAIVLALLVVASARAQNQPQTYAQQAKASAAWTSATAQDTRLTVPVANFSSVIVTLSTTSTMTGGGLFFETDDGSSSWLWPANCTRNSAFKSDATYPLSGPAAQSWECDISNWTTFGVRLNPVIVGTGTATIQIIVGASPGEPAIVAGQLDATQLQVTTQANANDPLMRAVNALNASVRALALRIGPALAVPVYTMNAVDPCTGPKGNVAVSQTASTRLVAGQGGRRIAVCSARIVAGAAEIPSFTEGTGAACGTNTLAVSGSTTAANGESYAANGGFTQGGGFTISTTAVFGNDLCLAQSGSNRLAGVITYVYY